MTLDDAIALHEALQDRQDAANAILDSDMPGNAPERKAARRELRAIPDEYVALFYALTEDWPTDLRYAIHAACKEARP